MKHQQTPRASVMAIVACATLAWLMGGLMGGCQLQQRRVDVPTASGADESLKDRFGLTADAQDPTEHDKEMGYGVWKAKPETEGTLSPQSPERRTHWGTVDN